MPTSRRTPGTIGLDRPPNEEAGYKAADEAPSRGRLFRARNALSFLFALLVLYLMYRELLGLDWQQVWTSARGANAGLFALAFAVFYASFPVRALRWKTLLFNVGYGRENRVPSTLGLSRIMYLAWFVNCLTVARLGDVCRGYLLRKEAGVSFAVTLGTVLAERIQDLAVLAAMAGAGALVVFGGSLPAEATQALLVGITVSVLGVVGLLSMRRFRGAIERIVPKRFRAHYASLEHGLVNSLGRLPLLLVYSAIGWLLEGTTLYVTAAAVGSPVPVAGALMVALIGSLLTTVPFTPGGLGFTEAGMVLLLGWLGLDTTTAGAVTLLFRLINYWSIVALGFLLYVFGRNGGRVTRGKAGTPGVAIKNHSFFTGRS